MGGIKDVLERVVWRSRIDPDRKRFVRRKIKIRKVGEEGPDNPLTPPGWTEHQSSVPAVVALPVPRVSNPEEVLSSGKVKGAGDKSLDEEE